MQEKLTTAEKRVPLTRVPAGKKVKVTELPMGGGSRGRLAGMGIVPGVEIKLILAHPLKGPIVVELDGNTVAIGHNLARRIMVDEQ
ncbi:MAG: ferrous iron transport protein A [Syntrophomonadaceae bacterium]|nr:ferrous iron transport protein A [Syntrophomonadaceae bacterium]